MYDIYPCSLYLHIYSAKNGFCFWSTFFNTIFKKIQPCLARRFFNCFNLRFSAAEKLSLFSTFDRDGSGSVSYDEFIRGVRGEMNDFRLEWVNKALAQL